MFTTENTRKPMIVKGMIFFTKEFLIINEKKIAIK
jgi:hypothetical protein